MKKLCVVLLLLLGSITPVHAIWQNSSPTDIRLLSLTITGAALSPEFSPATTSYQATVPTDSTSVVVAATAASRTASVSGLGSYQVGDNSRTIQIVVTSVRGVSNTYTINLERQKPKFTYNYKGKNLYFADHFDDVLVPNSFVLSTAKVNDQFVLALRNEKLKMTIGYLYDENKNGDFYIIENNKVTSLFKTIEVGKSTYINALIPEKLKKRDGFKYTNVTIDNKQVEGWVYNDGDKNYIQLYLTDMDGKTNIYQYDNSDKSLQKYKSVEVKKPIKKEKYLMQAIMLLLVLLIISLSYIIHINNRRVDEIRKDARAFGTQFKVKKKGDSK